MKDKITSIKELWLASKAWELPFILEHAISIQLFDYLQNARSLTEIEKNLGLNYAKIDAVLIFLVSKGFVNKVENKYVNSELSKRYLVSSSNDYFGHCISWKVKDSCNWKNNFGLVLKGKQPIVHGDALYEEYTDKNIDALEGIIKACSFYSSDDFANLVASYNIKGNLLDLGCGSGLWGLKIAEKLPELNLTLFDRTISFAKRILNERYSSLKNRTTLYEQDFFDKKCLPKAENVIIPNVLTDWNDEDVEKIISKVIQESNPQRLFIHEFLLEGDSVSAQFNVLANFETFGRVREKKFWENLLSKLSFSVEFEKMNFGSYAIVCSREDKNEKQ